VPSNNRALCLYDSASRSVREFVPLEAGKVSIYLCGATVQGAPHIGHIRSGVNFDILRRWLEHSGHQVTLVRNVTDIDDKILAKSTDAGVPWWAWAARYEREFSDAYELLGCLPPTYEPRATGHITEMIELIERLIDSGLAYPVGGDVYYDVRSFGPYGSLSGQKLDAMHPAADTDSELRKRDPLDFALWKRHKPGQPETASWPAPWGRGRPGWHLECSAMATRYLGSSFDIHGGGLDLVFPHHENEIAQSAGAGDGFAQYWMHNAWLTVGGEKMSKSLGNSMIVSELAKRWRPVELRYYLGAAHYRSNIEFSDEAMNDAAAAYRRIENFCVRAAELSGGLREWAGTVPIEFCEAMDDDLAVPRALGVVHEHVRAGNAALESGDHVAVAGAFGAVVAMTDLLGINPLRWRAESNSELAAVVDALVAVTLDARAEARARSDYAAADAIRDQLTAAGVAVEDTPNGPRWELKR
jgi:cysteinyl-tRNA synthetase